MNPQLRRLVQFVLLLTALAGCTKGTETPTANTAQPASSETSPESFDAALSVDASAADVDQQKSEPDVPAASEPATTPSAGPLDEQHILNEENGQWAATARASSTYAQSNDPKAGYAAWQVTGAPNVDRYSDNPLAWAAKSGAASAPEWLEVGFANPVHATSIRIRQTASPGAISRIELLDDMGIAHTIWEGVDETPYAKDTIGWFVRDVPKTSYLVKGARITLETARVWGWNEIDAVQLVGEK